MFKNKLYNIYERFKKESRNPAELLEERVQQKLERSLNNYNKELEDTLEFLLSKNPITILKGYLKTFGGNTDDRN